MFKRTISLMLSIIMILSISAVGVINGNAATKSKQVITGVKSSYVKSVKDKNFTLKAKAKGKISYSSNNKKVATVSKKGVVDVKSVGTATITIKAKATSKYKEAVKKVKINVGSIGLTHKTIANNYNDAGVVAFFKNNYNEPVIIDATCVFYDSNKKMIDVKNDSAHHVGSKQTTALMFRTPLDKEYNKVNYASYKISYTVKFSSSDYVKYTSFYDKIKINADRADNNLSVEVKNTSSKDMSYNAYFAVVYYDKDKNVIGYNFESSTPAITKGGSVGYFSTYYPYDNNTHDYVTPASYDIFVASAYNYKYSK